MRQNNNWGSSFDKLPDDVKEYLRTYPPDPEVLCKITDAFNAEHTTFGKGWTKWSRFERIKAYAEIIKLKKQIIKIFDSLYLTENLSNSIEAWEIQLKQRRDWKIIDRVTRPKYQAGIILGKDVIFKDWDYSLIISLETTSPRPEDWYDVTGCNFKFEPENIDITKQVELIKKFIKHCSERN